MTASFSQAVNTCSTLVEVTRQITKDATEKVLEGAYYLYFDALYIAYGERLDR
jgi:hypothetical protein